MTIDFTCQKCEGSFEIDAQDLLDGSEKLECPHCGVKATQAAVDDFTAALTELQAQVTTLSKKFTLSLTIDSDEAEADDDDELDDDDEDEVEEEDDDEDDDDDDDDDDDVDEDDDADVDR